MPLEHRLEEEPRSAIYGVVPPLDPCLRLVQERACCPSDGRDERRQRLGEAKQRATKRDSSSLDRLCRTTIRV